MKVYTIAISLIFSAVAVVGYEREVAVTAGDIAARPEAFAGDNELVLSGSVNAADLFALGQLKNLKTLNISNIKIESYSGERVENRYNYPSATIPDGAFACSTIENIVFPKIPTAIGQHCFLTSALKSISIPSTITNIGRDAFKECAFLEAANIDTENIAEDCFRGCKALKTVEFGGNVKTVAANAFRNTGITSLDLKNARALECLGEYAFADCKALTKAVLPSGIRETGEGVFFNCPELQSVTLSYSLKTIPALMFAGSPNVEANDHIIEGVEVFGSYSFEGNNTTRLELPSTLMKVKTGSMGGMKKLEFIDAGSLKHVPEAEPGAFKGTPQKNVKLKTFYTTRLEFCNAPEWKYFDILTVTGDNDAIINPEEDIKQSLLAALEEGRLYVKIAPELSPGLKMSLHSLAGNNLGHWQMPVDGNFETSVNASSGNVYIFTVASDKVKTTAIKILAK